MVQAGSLQGVRSTETVLRVSLGGKGRAVWCEGTVGAQMRVHHSSATRKTRPHPQLAGAAEEPVPWGSVAPVPTTGLWVGEAGAYLYLNIRVGVSFSL